MIVRRRAQFLTSNLLMKMGLIIPSLSFTPLYASFSLGRQVKSESEPTPCLSFLVNISNQANPAMACDQQFLFQCLSPHEKDGSVSSPGDEGKLFFEMRSLSDTRFTPKLFKASECRVSQTHWKCEGQTDEFQIRISAPLANFMPLETGSTYQFVSSIILYFKNLRTSEEFIFHPAQVYF